jgi:uncharacterized protein YjbI with pentapeptide repeats
MMGRASPNGACLSYANLADANLQGAKMDETNLQETPWSQRIEDARQVCWRQSARLRLRFREFRGLAPLSLPQRPA